MQRTDVKELKYDDLVQETSRQLAVCNACRYCEGFCAVWDAIEFRKSFQQGDVEYIANLCHDCGQCFDVCPFVPPNEFSVDIPEVLSEVRSRTYRKYSTPKVATKLFDNQAKFVGTVWVSTFIAVLLMYLFTGDVGRLFDYITVKGSFYVILPNLVIDVAGTALALFGVLMWIASGSKFLSATSNGGARRVSDYVKALRDTFAETWFKGGGAGCNYPEREERGNYSKLAMHTLVLYGFMLDFLATVSAFIMQDFLHILPPYPIISLPVISGLTGGVMIIAGALLFLYNDRKGNYYKKDDMQTIDRVFLLSLLLTAVTGIMLLVLRSTDMMGIILLIHISVVGLLFISAPYGKFVHLVYRYLSVVKFRQEERMFEESGQ